MVSKGKEEYKIWSSDLWWRSVTSQNRPSGLQIQRINIIQHTTYSLVLAVQAVQIHTFPFVHKRQWKYVVTLITSSLDACSTVLFDAVYDRMHSVTKERCDSVFFFFHFDRSRSELGYSLSRCRTLHDHWLSISTIPWWSHKKRENRNSSGASVTSRCGGGSWLNEYWKSASIPAADVCLYRQIQPLFLSTTLIASVTSTSRFRTDSSWRNSRSAFADYVTNRDNYSRTLICSQQISHRQTAVSTTWP